MRKLLDGLFLAFFCLVLLGPLSAAERAPKDIPNGKALLASIQREFQAHNYKEVIRLYRDFVEEHPDRYVPLGVQVLYSQALADTGDIEKAIRSLEEILAGLPTQIDPLKLRYDLANLLFLQRRFDEARAVYQRMILEARQHQEMLVKAKERMALMKDKDDNVKKKDLISLQLLDIETALEAGEVIDGVVSALEQIIEQNPSSPYAVQAVRLQSRVNEVRTAKAKAMLNEARRLYDIDKKYMEVREILEEITARYADVSEKPSIEALSKDVDARLGKAPKRPEEGSP